MKSLIFQTERPLKNRNTHFRRREKKLSPPASSASAQIRLAYWSHDLSCQILSLRTKVDRRSTNVAFVIAFPYICLFIWSKEQSFIRCAWNCDKSKIMYIRGVHRMAVARLARLGLALGSAQTLSRAKDVGSLSRAEPSAGLRFFSR